MSDDTLTAYIAVWAENRRGIGFNSPLWAGSYGIMVVGNGVRRGMWGAGYATNDDSLRALAAQRILQLSTIQEKTTIYTKGLYDHIRALDGHVRKARSRPGHTNANGQPYDLFDVYDALARDLDNELWEIHQIKGRDEPDQYLLAEQLAKGIGRETAIKLKPLHSHAAEIAPRNAILATDEDPDPYGLIAILDAAE